MAIRPQGLRIVLKNLILLHLLLLHLLLVLKDELGGKLIDVRGLWQSVFADASQKLLIGVDYSCLLEDLDYIDEGVRCCLATSFSC